MAKRAERVVFNDKFLRSLYAKKHPGIPSRIFKYDAIVPGLDVMWTVTALSWGMKKRWPGGGKNPTWRHIGTVYLPHGSDDVNEDELTAGALTLAEARAKARKWLDLLGRGVDPAREARKKKLEALRRTTWPALRAAFLKYYEGKAKQSEAKRILEKDFACWNNRFADEIDAGDVESGIQAILDRGSKYQAINAFGYIRTLYNWAVGKPSLRIKASPCAGLSVKRLIGKKRPRTRVLTDSELRAVWNACDKMGYPYGPIIRLLILTPVRENQIARMSRPELSNLDKADALLTVPSERMKGDDEEPPPPHEVPLTATMVEIIGSLPRFAGPYLFTSTAGQKPVNGWSKAKSRIDRLSAVTGWVIHDLRRTVRTRISAIPAEEHVHEALLAHGRRGIQAVYDQHRYRDEKRALLVAWEKKLFSIVNPSADPPVESNVVPLAAAAA